MPLLPIDLPPGAFLNGTEYEARGRWRNVNQVRWQEGQMRPIGGWKEALGGSTLTGTCRGGLAWRDDTQARWLALATEQELQVWNGGTLYDITPAGYTAGQQDGSLGYGYGAGPYGEEEYGTARSTSIELEATTWSMDTWGEYLVALASHEGIIYEWQVDVGTPAAAVANAPTARALLVTTERALVALGAGGDPRKVQWSDLADNTLWTAAATNQAGDQKLQTGGEILAGFRTRGQHLIITTVDAWTMRYQGLPFVYGFEQVGNDCGMVGRRAAVLFDGRVAWMGKQCFYHFDGSRVLPIIPCEVSDHVFGDINENQYSKIHTTHNVRFGEVWWFYCSDASTEVDRYVIWNYRENHWSVGELARLTMVRSGVWEYPFAVDGAGNVYEHEFGYTANGTSRGSTVYAESGPVEIAPGDRMVWANQLIPDERTLGDARVTIRSRFTPEGDETTHGPYTLSQYTDIRLQGRQIVLKVEQVADDDWRWGVPRLDVRPGSRR